MTDEALIDCPRCRHIGSGEIICPTCRGEGRVPDRRDPAYRGVIACEPCHGEGAIVCPTCDGEKKTTEARAAAWLLTAGED